MLKFGAHAKGRQFEDWIVERLSARGFRVERSPGSGNGNRIKGDIDNDINLSIEAKHTKNLPVASWRQTNRQVVGSQTPVLCWQPVGEMAENSVVVIPWHYFESLLQASQKPRTENPDRTMQLKAERLRRAISGALRGIGRLGTIDQQAMNQFRQSNRDQQIAREVRFSIEQLKREAVDFLKEFRGI